MLALTVVMVMVTSITITAFSLLPVLISIPLGSKRQINEPIPSKFLIFSCAQLAITQPLVANWRGWFLLKTFAKRVSFPTLWPYLSHLLPLFLCLCQSLPLGGLRYPRDWETDGREDCRDPREWTPTQAGLHQR